MQVNLNAKIITFLARNSFTRVSAYYLYIEIPLQELVIIYIYIYCLNIYIIYTYMVFEMSSRADQASRLCSRRVLCDLLAGEQVVDNFL